MDVGDGSWVMGWWSVFYIVDAWRWVGLANEDAVKPLRGVVVGGFTVWKWRVSGAWDGSKSVSYGHFFVG